MTAGAMVREAMDPATWAFDPALLDGVVLPRGGLCLCVRVETPFGHRARVSDASGREVAIPRRVFSRFVRTQAGKDRSASVCERVCVAAFRRPRLMGAELLSVAAGRRAGGVGG